MLLAGDFIDCILPARVMLGCRFIEEVMAWRTLICRYRANEDILIRLPREQLDIPFNILGLEGDPIDHRVEMLSI
ncbi:hypothetical protein D3C84_1119760 [compost metagenome]